MKKDKPTSPSVAFCVLSVKFYVFSYCNCLVQNGTSFLLRHGTCVHLQNQEKKIPFIFTELCDWNQWFFIRMNDLLVSKQQLLNIQSNLTATAATAAQHWPNRKETMFVDIEHIMWCDGSVAEHQLSGDNIFIRFLVTPNKCNGADTRWNENGLNQKWCLPIIISCLLAWPMKSLGAKRMNHSNCQEEELNDFLSVVRLPPVLSVIQYWFLIRLCQKNHLIYNEFDTRSK